MVTMQSVPMSAVTNQRLSALTAEQVIGLLWEVCVCVCGGGGVGVCVWVCVWGCGCVCVGVCVWVWVCVCVWVWVWVCVGVGVCVCVCVCVHGRNSQLELCSPAHPSFFSLHVPAVGTVCLWYSHRALQCGCRNRRSSGKRRGIGGT